MPADKGKVLVAIESKFKGKSISKTYKDSLATKWAAKITSDEEIDEYVADREDDVLEASAEADRRATTAAKTAKQEAADFLAGKKQDDKKDDLPDDPTMPSWAKAMMENQTKMSQELSGFKAARSAESLADRFMKDERLKGVPQFMLKKAVPQNEEDFENAVTELSQGFNEFATEHKLSSFGQDTPATGGIPNKGGKEGKVEPAILAFAARKVEEVKSTQKT